MDLEPKTLLPGEYRRLSQREHSHQRRYFDRPPNGFGRSVVHTVALRGVDRPSPRRLKNAPTTGAKCARHRSESGCHLEKWVVTIEALPKNDAMGQSRRFWPHAAVSALTPITTKPVTCHDGRRGPRPTEPVPACPVRLPPIPTAMATCWAVAKCQFNCRNWRLT